MVFLLLCIVSDLGEIDVEQVDELGDSSIPPHDGPGLAELGQVGHGLAGKKLSEIKMFRFLINGAFSSILPPAIPCLGQRVS